MFNDRPSWLDTYSIRQLDLPLGVSVRFEKCFLNRKTDSELDRTLKGACSVKLFESTRKKEMVSGTDDNCISCFAMCVVFEDI